MKQTGILMRHKFNARPKTVDGIKFHSTKEADYYEELLLKIKAGIVLYFHMQVPIRLPGGVKYVLDFLEFHANGTVHYIDTKGKRTDMYIAKKKIVEALYPFTIEER
jgi:hypothetical protein